MIGLREWPTQTIIHLQHVVEEKRVEEEGYREWMREGQRKKRGEMGEMGEQKERRKR